MDSASWPRTVAILPPGFSQAPPPEALFGSSNYQVHNKNIYGNPAFTLRCYRGSGVADGIITVPANSTRSMAVLHPRKP